MLADLRPSHPDLSGKDAEAALEAAGMTMNKNTVPGETRSPFVTSGLRIGTPAVSTRGLGEAEMRQIADWIAEVLAAPGEAARVAKVRAAVADLCQAFPLYPELVAVS
jgi:glycine hydroxymethyltransferase